MAFFPSTIRGCLSICFRRRLFTSSCFNHCELHRFNNVTRPLFYSTSSSAVETRVFDIMKRYEDIIGLTAVKEAQDRVIQAEDEFSGWQEQRREKQAEIKSVQIRLKEIHGELDKTSRGEDRYLNLLTQEHAVIKQERTLLDEFRELEKEERNKFNE